MKLDTVTAIIMALASAGVSSEVEGVAVQDSIQTVRTEEAPANGVMSALSVSGTRQGLRSTAHNEQFSRGIVGVITGAKEPGTASSAGVAGAGAIGVAGRGNVAGVQGESYDPQGTGVTGIAGAEGAGISGYGGVGVWASSATDYGSAVRAQALGSHAVAVYAVSGASSYAGYFNGDVILMGDCDPCVPADLRLKQNVRDYEGGLNTVLALSPKTYEMNVEEYTGRMQLPVRARVGLIAQDVEKILPDLVHEVGMPNLSSERGKFSGKSLSHEKFKAVNYLELIPILLKAVQEQQAEIEELRVRLDAR